MDPDPQQLEQRLQQDWLSPQGAIALAGISYAWLRRLGEQGTVTTLLTPLGRLYNRSDVERVRHDREAPRGDGSRRGRRSGTDNGHLQRSPALEELQRGFYAASNDGDLGFVERHLAHAPADLFVGTAAAVWDRTTALEAVAAQVAAGVRIDGGTPQAWVEGDIGWAVDLEPRFRLGEVVAPFRLTSLFHREDGQWRIVHWHRSLPVPTEEALDQPPPT